MRWNLLLAVVLGMSGVGHFLLRNDPMLPNLEVLPEMVRSVAYESYSLNPNFSDGKTLQLPPPHTIARGAHDFPYGPTEEEAARAGRELSNPFPPGDVAVLDRGADRYRTFCQHCHGPTGRGDGPVAMRGFPAPPPLNSEKGLQLKDGRIFHIITYGQKNMPAHGGQIPTEDRWRIVVHVRSLQRTLQAAAEEAKP
jgi:mono/diheme cytochrome c family protein